MVFRKGDDPGYDQILPFRKGDDPGYNQILPYRRGSNPGYNQNMKHDEGRYNMAGEITEFRRPDGSRFFTDNPQRSGGNEQLLPEGSELQDVYKQPQPQQPRQMSPYDIAVQEIGRDPRDTNLAFEIEQEYNQAMGGLARHLFNQDLGENQMNDDQLRAYNKAKGQLFGNIKKRQTSKLNNAQKVMDSTVARITKQQEAAAKARQKKFDNILKLKPSPGAIGKAMPGFINPKSLAPIIAEEEAKKRAKAGEKYSEGEYNAALDDMRKKTQKADEFGQFGFDDDSSRDKSQVLERYFNKFRQKKNKNGSPKYAPTELIIKAENEMAKAEATYWKWLDKHRKKYGEHVGPKSIEKFNIAFKRDFGFIPAPKMDLSEDKDK